MGIGSILMLIDFDSRPIVGNTISDRGRYAKPFLALMTESKQTEMRVTFVVNSDDELTNQ